MKKRHRRMIDTRRVYRLESEMYYDRRFSHITKQRSLQYLTSLAKKIWKKEGCKHQMPVIRFGKGFQNYSWCDGETIELVRTQRDELTLIHELVHAIGYDDHDKNFAARELILLDKYTPIKIEALYEKFERVL